MKGIIMNDDFANSVIYISKNLNRLADQASPHLYGMYKDAKPLGIEDVMEVRRILNEYNAQAYLLNLKIKEREEAQKNKKSFLKKLFKRKN